MQEEGTKVWRYAVRVCGGIAVWWTLMSVAHSVGIKWPEEHDVGHAIEWLASKDPSTKAMVLLGSSNVAYSLDCHRLDSICAPRQERWYNLGQNGMADFELLDYALNFIEHIDSGGVAGIYLEINARNVLEQRPNWRSVEVMTFRTIWEITRIKASQASTCSQNRNFYEQGLQSMLMKAVAPIHNWLYPEDFMRRLNTKGFHPAAPQQNWTPRTNQAHALIEIRRESEKAFNHFLKTGKAEKDPDDRLRVYPIGHLQQLQNSCIQKGITLRAICLPTERMEPWLNEVERLLGVAPLVLGNDSAHRPFTNPQYLRDVRHLNRHGTIIVSDQFARLHLEQAY
jgi:hypothetical protein